VILNGDPRPTLSSNSRGGRSIVRQAQDLRGRGPRRRQDLRDAAAGRAKLKEGVDIVIGVVETHGRKETKALLEGFEVLPRKPTVYVNRILNEFDIDAALKRRPSLILVDELAHTTIPGSSHPKRYIHHR